MAFRAYAIQNMTGTSGRQRARPEALSSYHVIVPDKEIWTLFALMLEPTFSKIKANSLQNQSLAILRDALLSVLVSGELQISEMVYDLQTTGISRHH